MDWLPKEEEDIARPMTIRAVVSEKYYGETPTVKVSAAVLNSTKHISRIVKSLGEILPVPSLKHLKRVRRTEGNTYVILDLLPVAKEEKDEEEEEEEETGECPAKKLKLDGRAYLEELKSKGFNYEEWGVVGVEEFDVPKIGPTTRLQYEKAVKYWPVNFHPEKKLETMLSEKVFEDEEQEHHVKCIRYVMRRSLREKTNTALVVDFERKEFLAAGTDRKEVHPLQHAVMVAVDAIAGLHGGGAWDLPLESLTFGRETPRSRVEETTTNLEPVGEVEEAAPYLCTGYDLYVLREPCVMCAMSLVHSRIRRVFFSVRDPEKGALVSRCQIHTIKDLNHHYDVFESVRE